MTSIFETELLKDEKILWEGQPDPSILFNAADIFLIPFSILWGGFAICWETIAITAGGSLLFSLWGIPFVLIGLYMIFGRFIYKSNKKGRTFYGITNQRVLVLVEGNNRTVNSEFIDRIVSMNKKENFRGAGTINFGNTPAFAMYENNGMEFLSGRYSNMGVAFYDIQNVNEAYNLVNEIRRG